MAPTAVSPPRVNPDHSLPSKLTYSVPEGGLPAIRHASPSPQTDIITPLRHTLSTESTPLAARFRALFDLKHHASLHPETPETVPAIHAIASAFTSPSALLKHELAYCLGQTGNLEAVPPLRAVLSNREEDPMCRHEAAEALGALGDVGSVVLLREMEHDQEAVVRETCELALGRIAWLHSSEGKSEVDGGIRKSDFISVDPAPPVAMMMQRGKDGKEARLTIDQLQARLMNVQLGLFERYRAMFALRDLASPPDLPTALPAVLALATGFQDTSALFRHEIAFVFGQLCHPASIPYLKASLARAGEMAMVRHEAAEALGSLGDEDGVEDFLKGFLDDPEDVVRESVVVALDMTEEGRELGNDAQEDFASRHR